MKKKVIIFYGTRPEYIKLVSVIESFKHDNCFEAIVVCTSQHQRKSFIKLYKIFDIYPDVTLKIRRKTSSLNELTSLLSKAIDEFLYSINPSFVLIQGDTATAVITAICAFHLKIPTGHVEAGLRTRNIFSPWPEEGYRQIIARLAIIHFAPTINSKRNLIKEAIPARSIKVTGNTVVDAFKIIHDKLNSNVFLKRKIESQLNTLTKTSLKRTRYVVITLHRRSGIREKITNVFHIIDEISVICNDIKFIWVTHPNPEIKDFVRNYDNDYRSKYLSIVNPLSYEHFIMLMNYAELVISDSGGIQEEAAILRKKVLLIRDNTERPESVAHGDVKVMGADYKNLKNILSEILKSNYVPSHSMNINLGTDFGDGSAGRKILNITKNYLR